ncbi:VWA-like domain-containing protein [Clostridium sp. SHJSY1]|uniref:vWA domain-containing protein n=1 Tax=Clostridium sp. SHJSY1 TaxID=2942483 RepID=UPI002875A379|nr:VWA-like domain-containing protein [Clostridium sp. SHJSY1]MDS0525561.1 VWA-like domain-containing protein [Clostridium sp. SHJSY1]
MFEEKRQKLLKKVLDIKFTEDLKSDFSKEFFDLVGSVVIEMLDGEDDFFGTFMLKIERNIRLDITWPLSTLPRMSGFLMYFNPVLFLQLSKKEMMALFKHEIYHIMYSHYERVNILKNSYSREAISLAIDISINQFIKNLPVDAKKIDMVNREFNIDLKGDRSIEEYAKVIQESINKRVKNNHKDINSDSVIREIDIEKAHELWEDSELSEETIEGNVKKIALSIVDKNTPEALIKVIKGFTEKEELSWQQILKKLIPSVKSGYRKTITRRDRRQPYRMDLRGKLPNSIPEIIVAIDISASMTDEDIRKIMIEILAITANRRGKIIVIECDNEIRSIYPLRSVNDIRKRTANNGSTEFSPVFEYIKEERKRNSILIYFTDGVGEKELSIKPTIKDIIWVIIGEEDLSLKNSYGKVKRIKSTKKIGEGKSTALDMVREVIHDWAR